LSIWVGVDLGGIVDSIDHIIDSLAQLTLHLLGRACIDFIPTTKVMNMIELAKILLPLGEVFLLSNSLIKRTFLESILDLFIKLAEWLEHGG